MQNIFATIESLLKYHSENHALDFKEVEYPLGNHEKKHELLKDISAFANHPSNEDKYVIVGVREKNGLADAYLGLDNVTDDAKYQQFVNSNIEPKINFEYREFFYNGCRLAYFRIFDNVNRPYLFSKELKTPFNPGKIEFRVGDGYVRQGTSTRKMAREDFEGIYKERYSTRDRRSDIKITPYLAPSTDDDLWGHDLQYIDFHIENISSKSINLDAEIRIAKVNGIYVKSVEEVKQAIRVSAEKRLYGLATFDPVLPSFDLSIEHFDNHTVATRLKLKGNSSAISIAQHDIEPDVFCQSLIVIANQAGKIKCELTLRSDDFTEGKLVQIFSIPYEESSLEEEF